MRNQIYVAVRAAKVNPERYSARHSARQAFGAEHGQNYIPQAIQMSADVAVGTIITDRLHRTDPYRRFYQHTLTPHLWMSGEKTNYRIRIGTNTARAECQWSIGRN